MARGFLSLGGGVRIQVKNFPDDSAPDGVGLTLNNSVVTGNLTAVESGELDAGGGIAVIGSFYAATGTTAAASLTLNDTTVSNNAASNGGGIVCVLCALSASSATITGNTANAGDGGGIVLTGNSSGASLLRSALTLNTVSGGLARGGGMSVPVGTSPWVLNRTRIAANTGVTGTGLYRNQGTIFAPNNWWGCNYGPGAGGPGCAGTANSVVGPGTTSPFLVLKAGVSPVSALILGSTTMTADLTFNSANADTSAGGHDPGRHAGVVRRHARHIRKPDVANRERQSRQRLHGG